MKQLLFEEEKSNNRFFPAVAGMPNLNFAKVRLESGMRNEAYNKRIS